MGALTDGVLGPQVFYRTHGQGDLRVLSTNRTSAELPLPLGLGCEVHVRATTAGGDGASSEPVRIPGITSKRSSGLPPQCPCGQVVRATRPTLSTWWFICAGWGGRGHLEGPAELGADKTEQTETTSRNI